MCGCRYWHAWQHGAHGMTLESSTQVHIHSYLQAGLAGDRSRAYQKEQLADPLDHAKIPTTDLVLAGTNFGTEGTVYCNDEPQDVASWSHDRITLTYDGTEGDVYVRVGAKASATVSFSEQSPRILVDVPAFQPDATGYRTSGLDRSCVPSGG